ncbi:MAG: FAD-dependent oxidoreductase [Snowella sp.]|nr:FAD-dependent oxidoreductase [Snowella sp.]
MGEEKARLYAESNRAGIECVAQFIAQEQIDCDFSRKSAYTFAETDDELDKIKDEIEAALKIELPATFVQEISLPFAIAGAIKLHNQAQFYVRKYLLHLAKSIPGNGSHLFENTRVESVYF